MKGLGYSIKVVAQLTGLTPHVIRIWEKRYAAVTPERTPTNRRIYREVEIDRLRLLGRATAAGHSIKNVASVPTDKLRRLLGEEAGAAAPVGRQPAAAGKRNAPVPLRDHLEEALRAVRQLDSSALDRIFHQAGMEVSHVALIRELIAPLIQRIGELWETGELKIIHEHMASASIRTFIGNFMRQHSAAGFAPPLVVTTPAGQVHELGALLAAAEANNHGWRVCYLGPSLPAEEIASAAVQQQAQAIALSIVYPADDPHLAAEFLRLRQLLPKATLLVGGRATPAYQAVLDQIGAISCPTLTELGAQLARLRAHTPSTA